MNSTKKRPGTSQMIERFGPNFAPGLFALQQSVQLVYMLRALSRGQIRETGCTTQHIKHTLGNGGDTTQQPTRDSKGELADAAAVPPPPLPLLLHDPRCIKEHNLAQQRFCRFMVFWNARRSE